MEGRCRGPAGDARSCQLQKAAALRCLHACTSTEQRSLLSSPEDHENESKVWRLPDPPEQGLAGYGGWLSAHYAMLDHLDCGQLRGVPAGVCQQGEAPGQMPHSCCMPRSVPEPARVAPACNAELTLTCHHDTVPPALVHTPVRCKNEERMAWGDIRAGRGQGTRGSCRPRAWRCTAKGGGLTSPAQQLCHVQAVDHAKSARQRAEGSFRSISAGRPEGGHKTAEHGKALQAMWKTVLMPRAQNLPHLQPSFERLCHPSSQSAGHLLA